MTAMRTFSRIGQPIQIPFSASSAGAMFDFTLPANAMTFMFVNPTPYDVRLEGFSQGQNGAVSATTGWLVMARSAMGPFRTKNPVKMSAQAFSTSGVPLTGSEDFSGCWLELIYGDGD